MASSTFEVRETENDNDKVIDFGLETCAESEMSVSTSVDDVPKDHNYTKELDNDEEEDELFKSQTVPDSQPAEVDEENETTEPQDAKNTRAKRMKKVKPEAPKVKPKKESAPKKESSPRKSKAKKEVLTEEANIKDENGVEEKPEEKDVITADEQTRPKRKSRKRKVEEKENVLDRSIVEEVENINDEGIQAENAIESPAKKKSVSADSNESVKDKKPLKKKASPSEDTEDHSNLPKGWVRKTVVRKSGKSKGQVDVYIYSPDGIKFRSKPDIAAYIARTKERLNLEDFDFSKKRMSSSHDDTPAKPITKKVKAESLKSKQPAAKKKTASASPKKRQLKVKISFSPKKSGSTKKRAQQSKNKSPVKSEKSGDAKGKLGSIIFRNADNIKKESNDTNQIFIDDQITVNTDSENEQLNLQMGDADSEQLCDQIGEIRRADRSRITIIIQDTRSVNTSTSIPKKISKRSKRLLSKKGLKKQLTEAEKSVIKKSIIDEVQCISESSNHLGDEPVSLPMQSPMPSKCQTSAFRDCYELCSTLPDGWSSETVYQKFGKSSRKNVCLYSPDGLTLSSRLELATYLKRKNLSLTVDDFYVKRCPESQAQEQILDNNESSTLESSQAQSVKKTKKHKCEVKLPKMPKKQSIQPWSPFVNVVKLPEVMTFENIQASEHTKKEIEVSQSQVNAPDIPESPSNRPRRAVIHKSARDLLNMPKKIHHQLLSSSKEKSVPTEMNDVTKEHIKDKTGIALGKKSGKRVARNLNRQFSAYLEKKTGKENVIGKSVSSGEKLFKAIATVDGKVKKRLSQNPPSSTEKNKSKGSPKKHSGVSNSDTTLPVGWSRTEVERKSGKTAGMYDIYIFSPDGHKFRSRPSLAAYLVKNKLPISLDVFNFTKKPLEK